MILLPHPLGLETPLRALGFEPEALDALEALSVFLVEDLAACTRTELADVGTLDAAEIARIDVVLQAVGLSLQGGKAREMPYRHTPAPLPRRHPRATPAVSLERFDGLAFTLATLRQIERLGLTHKGQLQAMTVRELVIHFRSPQAKEIHATLTGQGLGFRDRPAPFELWRLGLIPLQALQWPIAASTPVRELRPWMGGGAVRALIGEGIATLADLRTQVRADRLEAVPLRQEERRRVLETLIAHDAPALEAGKVVVALSGAVLASTALREASAPDRRSDTWTNCSNDLGFATAAGGAPP